MPMAFKPTVQIDVVEDHFLLLVNSLSTLHTGRLVLIVKTQSNWDPVM